MWVPLPGQKRHALPSSPDESLAASQQGEELVPATPTSSPRAPQPCPVPTSCLPGGVTGLFDVGEEPTSPPALWRGDLWPGHISGACFPGGQGVAGCHLGFFFLPFVFGKRAGGPTASSWAALMRRVSARPQDHLPQWAITS